MQASGGGRTPARSRGSIRYSPAKSRFSRIETGQQQPRHRLCPRRVAHGFAVDRPARHRPGLVKDQQAKRRYPSEAPSLPSSTSGQGQPRLVHRQRLPCGVAHRNRAHQFGVASRRRRPHQHCRDQHLQILGGDANLHGKPGSESGHDFGDRAGPANGSGDRSGRRRGSVTAFSRHVMG